MTFQMEGGPLTEAGSSEFRIRGRVVLGMLFAVLLVGGIGGWAATSKISGAVIASGSVVVDQNLKNVQHRDGGIISEILVREGDEVRAGQVLFRLDDAQTRAERSILSSKLVELSVRRARLEAERDRATAFPLTDALLALGPEARAQYDGELRIFKGNLAARESEKEQLRLSIAQIEDEVGGLLAQRAAKADEIALVEDQLERTRALLEKKLVEQSRLYTIDRELVRLRGELGEIDASIARTRNRINEVEIQILSIDEDASTAAQQELSTVETQISEIEDRLAAINDRLSRTDIKAPIDGTINELNVHTVGGVITPAEVLVTIVPQDAKLNIRAMIPPQSIDQVREDQSARLRFPAFNQRVTPELHGKVSYISPATSKDPVSNQPAYAVHVDVPADELAKLEGQRLVPGMPVEVYLTTEERTVLSYFVKPIVDRFSAAFRER